MTSLPRSRPPLFLLVAPLVAILVGLLPPLPLAAQDAPAPSPRLYVERPNDPPAEHAAADDPEARSPGARIAFGAYLSRQVNVDGQGRNIVGDAANEPSIAIDPGNRQNMVIGWRQFDSVNSDFRQGGWAYSHDGGLTWTFPGVLEPGVFRSDPALDTDNSGNFYYDSLKSDFSMDFYKSLNGGESWLPKVPAYGGDKNWGVVDKTGGIGDGNVYAIWQRPIGCCGANVFTRSIDGAASFQYPVPVTNNPAFGILAIGPEGTVYAGGVKSSSFGQDLGTFVVSRSTNAKNPAQSPTFQGVVVNLGGAMVFGGGPNPDGLSGQGNVAVDWSTGPSRGDVYLLSSVDPPGSDPLDVRIARSTNGGVTWTPSARVNDDPTGNGAYQWFGTLSVAPNRRLDVVWNDTRNSGQTYVSQLFYSYSYDGGFSWSPNVAISPSFSSNIGWPRQNKLGDYYTMISEDSQAHLAWAATFNGEQDVYYTRVFPDCNGNGTSDVDDIAGGASHDDNDNDIPDECESPLVLAQPVPGLPGQNNTFSVSGATPGQTISFRGSVTPGRAAVGGCAGLNLDMDSPLNLGSAVADANGNASLTRFLPPGAKGRTILLQAYSQASCVKSNLVVYEVP